MNRKQQRGATIVEAAVTTLLLFTMLFGILVTQKFGLLTLRREYAVQDQRP